jgi:GR25 family glycosyltransferase involved in LPS biosynthesis
MILDHFDMAYYINLDSRPDRREQFERRAMEAGIDTFIRFPAIALALEEANAFPNLTKHEGDTKRHRKLSCSLSHFAVIQEAKTRGYESVLIFEDDAVFVDDFANRVRPYIEELQTILDWSLLYFGGSPEPDFKHTTYPSINITPHLYTIDSMWGTHAYAIHQRFYDTVLNSNPATNYPMDIFYIHCSSDTRKYIMTKELLVIQDDLSVSDLCGSAVSRTETYKENYRKVVG